MGIMGVIILRMVLNKLTKWPYENGSVLCSPNQKLAIWRERDMRHLVPVLGEYCHAHRVNESPEPDCPVT